LKTTSDALRIRSCWITSCSTCVTKAEQRSDSELLRIRSHASAAQRCHKRQQCPYLSASLKAVRKRCDHRRRGSRSPIPRHPVPVSAAPATKCRAEQHTAARMQTCQRAQTPPRAKVTWQYSTRGVAVAVSAISGTFGNSCLSMPSFL
jgi:hypothetical protein